MGKKEVRLLYPSGNGLRNLFDFFVVSDRDKFG